MMLIDKPALLGADDEAFVALWQEHATNLRQHIGRLLFDSKLFRGTYSEDADDLTQDTCIKAARAYSRTAHSGKPLNGRAWLYQIATNVCRDEIRHRKLVKFERLDAPPVAGTQVHSGMWVDEARAGGQDGLYHISSLLAIDGGDPGDHAEHTEQTELIGALVTALPNNQRAAIVDHYARGLTYDAIAERQHMTRAAVKSLLHRARQNVGAAMRASGYWAERAGA